MTAVLCEDKAWVFISPVCSQTLPTKDFAAKLHATSMLTTSPTKDCPAKLLTCPSKIHSSSNGSVDPIGSSGRQCPCLILLFEIKAAVEQTLLHNKLCKVPFHLLRYIRTPQLHSIAHTERNELIAMYIFVLFWRLPIHHSKFFRQRWIMSVAPHCKEQHYQVSIQ